MAASRLRALLEEAAHADLAPEQAAERLRRQSRILRDLFARMARLLEEPRTRAEAIAPPKTPAPCGATSRELTPCPTTSISVAPEFCSIPPLFLREPWQMRRCGSIFSKPVA
jgi:hypothetical protein